MISFFGILVTFIASQGEFYSNYIIERLRELWNEF